ncbi:uncharacterized protein LOC127760201 [Oryza glaberrima]|uniref:Uncharacterized protein n=1 Tax=Oryza glaberrima TaxID=4538 RepID=I1NUI8_ORYGL|nr:uncharacterized protein LOC127760201 [Oryza glaberrima]
MARYYSEVDHCAEEMNRPPHAGGEHYAVRRESYEEVDEMARAGRGHHHGNGGGGGHLGYSGSRHGDAHLGGHREEHLVHGDEHRHGHGGERQYDSCTGQYYG